MKTHTHMYRCYAANIDSGKILYEQAFRSEKLALEWVEKTRQKLRETVGRYYWYDGYYVKCENTKRSK